MELVYVLGKLTLSFVIATVFSVFMVTIVAEDTRLHRIMSFITNLFAVLMASSFGLLLLVSIWTA